MKKCIVAVIVFLVLCGGAYSQGSPPTFTKWGQSGDFIYNKRGDSVAIITGTDTTWFSANVLRRGLDTVSTLGPTIESGEITNATILGDDIAANTITGGRIAATTITASNIADSAITVGKIDHSDAETNWLNALYETIANVGKIGNDTTTWNTVATAFDTSYTFITVDSSQLDTITTNKVKIATTLILGADSITDITGSNLSVTGGVLSASGAGTADSVGIDTDGNGTVDNYLYSTVAGAAHIKKGSNITLTVAGDTVTIAGTAGSGTADSMGIDTDGNGTVDSYLYSTTAGAFHLKKGSNITLTVLGDTVTIASTGGGGGLWDTVGTRDTTVLVGSSDTLMALSDTGTSTSIETQNSAGFMFLDPIWSSKINLDSLDIGGEVLTDLSSTTIQLSGGQLVLGVGVVSSTHIINQTITPSDMDTTAKNYPFDGAYHITTATEDSAYITIQTLEDTAALRLLLSGGQITGNITMAGTETVDGIDISVFHSDYATDSTKLDGIEAGATADQTFVDSAGEVTDQTIDGNDIDSTAENFVFSGAYHVTSTVADSAYMSKKYIDDAAGGLTAQSVKGDHVDSTAEDFVFVNPYKGTSAVGDSVLTTRKELGDTSTAIRADFPAALTNQGVKGDHVDSTAEDFVFVNPYKGTSAVGDSVLTTRKEMGDTSTAIRGDFPTGLSAQAVKGDHVDSTAENFVFVAAYEGTSAEADSQYSTHNWVQAEVEDSLNEYSLTSAIVAGYLAKADSGTWDEVVAKIVLNQAIIGNASDSGEADSNVATRGYVQVQIEDSLNEYLLLSGGPLTGAVTTNSTFDTVDVGALGATVPKITDDTATWKAVAAAFDTNYAQITLATILGALDAGGATSLEIPNSSNPTVDADGEIAYEPDDGCFRVKIGDSTAAIGAKKFFSATLALPKNLYDSLAVWTILPVRGGAAPFGIYIDSLWIETDNSSSYSVIFEEWSAPQTETGDIDTIATSTSYTASGVPSDREIAAGARIKIRIPATTGTKELIVGGSYWIKTGD